MQYADMLGYIFISSGAISTQRPDKYPARAQQIRNLRYLFHACGIDDPKIYVEKATRVEGLDALPKLKSLLLWAKRNQEKIVIDDFRRIFYKTPYWSTKDLVEELLPFAQVFWEGRYEGRSLADALRHDIRDLVQVDRQVQTELNPAQAGRKSDSKKSARLRAAYTRGARAASLESRGKKADSLAMALDLVRSSRESQGKPTTLQDIADEANESGLQTSRGGKWSAATVKRMLDRAKKLEGET